uniref:Uncharacterized protein n=1 Tax=Arundo donax TaxID=35708 RepID=A0A0A8YSJ9_ARUDO
MSARSPPPPRRAATTHSGRNTPSSTSGRSELCHGVLGACLPDLIVILLLPIFFECVLPVRSYRSTSLLLCVLVRVIN